MTIKKQFVELVELLEANKGKKVDTLLPQILEMCESKKQGSTVIKDKNGKVLAIFCYYHKQWEIVADVEYGKKANTATGLNTMCKTGVSKWTKAQRDAKQAKMKLLEDVSTGEVEPSKILELQAEIDHNRTVIDVTDMPIGFASEAEVLEQLNK